MAHLGLARAHALAGNSAESRKSYETLLDIWKGADDDLPFLRTARDELAALR
jgi:hypothetical protein